MGGWGLGWGEPMWMGKWGVARREFYLAGSVVVVVVVVVVMDTSSVRACAVGPTRRSRVRCCISCTWCCTDL